MISWMQRHRKYLIVTIWISTIAFIGAGFVGWGQYSYGDKSSSIAKVGEVSITARELQQTYSQLFSQYSQMFRGDFDQEKAKAFGLEKQALSQLVNRAYIINLAKEYNLYVSDKELFDLLKEEKAFYKNGAFDKDVYKDVLTQNRITPADYESDMKNVLLVQKVFTIIEPQASELETKSITAAMYIADKIKYAVVDPNSFSINSSEEELKNYYEANKENFKTLPAYKVEMITQKNITKEYSDSELSEYYESHKHNFKNSEEKILSAKEAKAQIIAALNDKASKKEALRTYIDYKKEKLDADVKKEILTINQASANLPRNIYKEVTKLTPNDPYLKPRKVGANYVVLKLLEQIPSKVKSFEVARDDVAAAYNSEKKHNQLIEYANKSLKTFKGETTDFITREDVEALKDLEDFEAVEFLNQLFEQQNRDGYIILKNNKVVLFNILEQKLLEKENAESENLVKRLKENLLNQGLIEILQNKYQTQTFVKGI